MNIKPLHDDHIKYVVIRYYIEHAKIVDIYKELTDVSNLDEDGTNQYHIKPLKLSLHNFYKRIHKFPKTTIQEIKDVWLQGILNEPLSNKRIRIKELTKAYHESTDPEFRRKLLKDIKEEVGEDSWQQALKESGNKPISVDLSFPIKELADLLSKAADNG